MEPARRGTGGHGRNLPGLADHLRRTCASEVAPCRMPTCSPLPLDAADAAGLCGGVVDLLRQKMPREPPEPAVIDPPLNVFAQPLVREGERQDEAQDRIPLRFLKD